MYLFKISEDDILQKEYEWHVTCPIPVKGHSSPVVGDLTFVWIHEDGLFAECIVSGYPEEDPSLVSLLPVAFFSPLLLGSEWLAGADREKKTLRSKLHCLRTSRIWQL